MHKYKQLLYSLLFLFTQFVLLYSFFTKKNFNRLTFHYIAMCHHKPGLGIRFLVFLANRSFFDKKSVNRSFALFKSANCSFPSFEKSEKSDEEQSALNRSLLKEHRHFCHPNWYDNQKEKSPLLKRMNYLK